MIEGKTTCGTCAHWSHAKKRNISNPESPLYYAECAYPVDQLVLPVCVSFEETSEHGGIGCPCFAPLQDSKGIVNA